ncbi:colostrum trypsin inhibitor-like [Arctopsyche grandis]|uniref:colostrum trypsin inhibitor-like n=1 Tax=Arctopsyche grandis TaxID=121162 RepID=UPI00406D6FFD
MAHFLSTVLRCALLFFVLFEIQNIEGKPATSDDYDDAVEVGIQSELPVDEKLDPRIICKLPMKRGNCRALLLRWKYDPVTGVCEEFKYGGCAGNANNFGTRKQCMKMCEGF